MLRSVAVDTANQNKVVAVGYGFEFPTGSTYVTVDQLPDDTTDAIIADQKQGLVVCLDPTTHAVTTLPVPVTMVAPGSGAGTGATTVFVASAIQPSTDVRGTITITAGTNPTPDSNGHYQLAVITFSQAFPQPPVDVMTTQPGAAAQALGRVFGDTFSTTGFALYSTNAPVGTFSIGYALA